MSIRQRHDTMEVIQLEEVINGYISREFVQDATLLPLGNATPLLETGVLDSLSLLRLVLFVQELFGIVVDDVDLIPEHFDSVDAICAYLRSRTRETAAKADGRG
jgi:2-hydroxymuconate-semialdehyde hydrolase